VLAAFAGYEKPAKKQYMDADAAKNWFALTGGRIPGVQMH
jgi:hypothetical protein